MLSPELTVYSSSRRELIDPILIYNQVLHTGQGKRSYPYKQVPLFTLERKGYIVWQKKKSLPGYCETMTPVEHWKIADLKIFVKIVEFIYFINSEKNLRLKFIFR